MANKNRCYKRLRITEAKFRQVIRYFALDFTAADTAKLTGVSVRSVKASTLRPGGKTIVFGILNRQGKVYTL